MIQDIFPKRFFNAFDPGRMPGVEDTVFSFCDGEVLGKEEDGELIFPCVKDIREPSTKLQYLFAIDEEAFFLYPGQERREIEGFSYLSSKSMRRMDAGPRYRIFALFTAEHLWRWYKDNVYCGTCGTQTIHSKTERAMCCPSCGRVIYPRIMPAVIVGVTNGDRLLCTKYAGRDIPYYALVAGFTEIGETIEETVRREVMEEAGLAVKNIRYYRSQPWGIADDILMGFYCDVDGEDTIRMDDGELKEAIWVERAKIQLQPTDYALTNEMMDVFRRGEEPR